jgi:CheY-like chemotaxis protein
MVEDSRFLRIANARALAKAGYSVVCVRDGEAALLAARQNPPNLILLDMMLPKVDGLQVLRALKSEPETANIPVIVLTGLPKTNEAKLRKEGAIAFFTKSDSLLTNHSDTLIQLIESVMGKPEVPGSLSVSLAQNLAGDL